MKTRILFVDDEPNVLRGLRRMLHGMRGQWEMCFVQSGAEALDLIGKERFDVIVSDMRMPGMDGARLLEAVKNEHPHMVRIILSGHSDEEMILKSVRPAHQYLSKPCDAEVLKSTVSRACALRELLTRETLKGVVSRMESLPSLPALFTEIMEELQSEDVSIRKIGAIIGRDLGMTTKVLQLVNSAFFGIPRHITDPAKAVSLLGLETIRALVLTLEVFSQFDSERMAVLDFEALWEHSFRTGTLVKRIAQQEQAEKQLTDDAYLAGLLHDIGKLVLVENFSEQYRRIEEVKQAESLGVDEAEIRVMGASHAEVGAYLLGLWALPDPIVEAVAFHHHPERCPEQSFIPLAAVHIANALDHEIERCTAADGVLGHIDDRYLQQLGVSEKLDQWRRLLAGMTAEETTGERKDSFCRR